MNIRKVLAGSLAAITAGATLVFAGFGVGIADYVSATGSTLTSPIYIIGDDAKSPDTLGLTDIATAFAGYATTTVSAGGAATTTVSGGVLIDSDLNKTYTGSAAGNYLSNVMSSVTATDMPTLLATQEFTDLNASTIQYLQQIDLGSQTVQFGKPSDFTEPSLYTMFGSTVPYTLKIIFLGGLDTSAVDSSLSLTLFGKEYTFGSGVQSNTSLELFSSTGAQTVTLSGFGAEETVTLGDNTYNIKLNGWSSDGSNVYLLINGAATSPAGWATGYHTISGTSDKIYVKEISVIYTGAQEAQGQVTLFIGADKLELQNNTAVEKNDEALVNVMPTFDSSGVRVNSISISVAPDIDTYVADGGAFEDPLFGSFSFALGGYTPGMDGRDTIVVGKEGTNKVKLTFKNKAGVEYSIPVFFYDTAATAWEQTVDGTHEFWLTEANGTTGAGNITTGDYFVLSVAGTKETYIYKYSSYYPSTTKSSRYVTLTDVTSGVSQKVYLETSDNNLRIGTNAFAVNWTGADYGTGYSIMVDLDGDGNWLQATTVNMYSQTGAIINAATVPQVHVTEAPLFTITGSNEPAVNQINVTAAYSSNDVSLGDNLTTNQVGTSNVYEGVTAYGTHATRDTDADKVTLSYSGDRPAYANVAVGADPTFTTAGGAVSVEQAVKVTSPVSKLASEVNTATLNADVVLVGGPCANSLVATLADAGHLDTCADWSYTTGIIKEVEDAFVTGKKALIVAGTSAADTRSLAAKVMQGTLSFQV